MSGRVVRSTHEDRAAGTIPSRRRRPVPADQSHLPLERPARPKSITWMFHGWSNWSLWHPLVACLFIYLVAGQILITSIGMPFAWYLPLPLTDGELPIPLALAYIPVLGLGGLMLTFGGKFHLSAKIFFLLSGLATGAWMCTVQVIGIYDRRTFYAILTGCLIASFAYPGMRHAQDRFEEWWWISKHPIRQAGEDGNDAGPEPPRTRAQQWEDAFGAIFGYVKGSEKTDPWGRRTGLLTYVEEIPLAETRNRTVIMRLPKQGLEFKRIASDAGIEAIERQFNLPDGSVRIERVTGVGDGGDSRPSSTDFMVHFDVVDILARNLEMDTDDRPRSVRDAFRIGKFADGSWITLTLAEVHAMIIGLTGAGKSNLLHVIIWQLSRCYDVVIWVMDFKGGVFARPWVIPWYQGRASRPVLDWVATTLAEAWKMLITLFAIVEWRNSRVVGSKWRVSRATPAIFLICDEFSEAVGAHAAEKPIEPGGPTTFRMSKLFTRMLVKARSAGVWMVLAGQRNTVDMFGSGTAVTQIKVRVGMQVTNAGDASRIFGQANHLAAKMLQRLRHGGSMLLQWGSLNARIMVGKCMFVGDDDELLERIARVAVQRVADPNYGPSKIDAESLAAGLAACPDGWSERWTDVSRLDWLVNVVDTEPGSSSLATLLREPDPPAEPRRSASEEFRARREAARARREEERSQKNNDPVWDALVGPLEDDPQFDKDRIENIEKDPEWQDTLNEDLSPEGLAQSGSTREEPEEGDTDKVAAVVEIVDSYGGRGARAEDIKNGLITRGVITHKGRSAYRRFVLTALADNRIYQPIGAGGRYYTPRHLGIGAEDAE
jgi:hypothetical protein